MSESTTCAIERDPPTACEIIEATNAAMSLPRIEPPALGCPDCDALNKRRVGMGLGDVAICEWHYLRTIWLDEVSKYVP